VENTFNHIDDLIGKYLAQEASAEETKFLHTWLSQSEANRRRFDQFKMIFDSAATVKNLPAFDTDEAWSNLKARLHQKPEAKTVQLQSQVSIGLFWRIAASIVFVLGAGFFAYQMMKPASVSTIEVATQTAPESDTLPDGSGVFLNKETKLAYTYDRKKKTHTVKLKGEAYFNIQHDDDKTFVVEVEDVLIKDIGTSFNVKAYPEANTIEVVVEQGEVMFYTEKDSGIYLRAGGKGVYHKDTKTFTVEQIEPNVTAYKTKFFIFSDSDLATVMEELNAVYDKRIRIAGNLKNCRLTVSFNNENIDEIATVIAETLGLTVKTTDQEIVLEGKGCE